MQALLAALVLCLASSVSASLAGFTEQDIAALNLCQYFEGDCQPHCQNFFRHRWGLPLCPDLSHKCCAPDSLVPTRVEESEESSETTTPPPTTTTEGRQHEQALGDQARPSLAQDKELRAQCGRQPEVRRRKRIVGGGPAPRGSWPWLLALRSALGPHVCAGALVSPRYLVTAAHCFAQFTSPSMYKVREGEYDLLETDPTERDLDVEQIFIHPGYNRHAPANGTDYERWSHDIAVVKLASPAEATPICLPFDDAEAWALPGNEGSRDQLTAVEQKGSCWVAGWGHTNDDSSDMVLKQVQAPVHDSHHCSQQWNQHIGHDMVCFGDGLSGPCGGDSGGPLSCQLEGRHFLAGVVSWGAQACDRHGYPSVFIRVLPYMAWIQEIVG